MYCAILTEETLIVIPIESSPPQADLAGPGHFGGM